MDSLTVSKHVENVIRIKFKEVYLFGFIMQFIMKHGQYNIKSRRSVFTARYELRP